MLTFFIAGISYVSYLQYSSFRQQADTLTKKHQNALIALLDTEQQRNRRLINSLSNNWHLIDNVTIHNIDRLLDVIIPYHDFMNFDLVNIYDLNGITMARADTPGVFGKPDELYPLVLETVSKPVIHPLVAKYNGELILLSLKRLDGNYGPIGVIAVGKYLDQKMVDDFASEYHLNLKLYYDGNGVLSSLKDQRVTKINKQRKSPVDFSGQIIGTAPLQGELIEDISLAEKDFWSNLFILISGISLISLLIVYASRRIIVSAANSLDKARALAEKKTSELKAAYDEMEHRVEERTSELKNVNIELEEEITVRIRAEKALNKSHERLLTVMDSLDALVYVADMDTYELLFVNKYGREIWGEITGKICWKSLQSGQTEPCQFCTNKKLLNGDGNPTGVYIWTLQNTVNQEWYECRDQAIRWTDGRLVRMEIATNITERKKVENQLKSSLREKETLLLEIHHRVKNNMQIISSLLSLQSRYIKDKHYISMFNESRSRIKSMALIHEKLYQSKNLENIDFNDYIKSLVNDLFIFYGIQGGHIVLNINIENVILDIDTAIPCGLIINELISNSLKHAFPDGREGKIEITSRKMNIKGVNEYELIVSDNGIGMPDDLDFRKTESLGLSLIVTLSEDQLQGKLDFKRDNGTECRIHFKELKHKENR